MTKIFKIYDGKTNFWQWEKSQKLIVLDDSITDVRFSSKDLNYAIPAKVYDAEGMRLCDVPDILLQFPKNLLVYARANNTTVALVKYAVAKCKNPEGNNVVVPDNTGKVPKFENTLDATAWAKANGKFGIIVTIKVNGQWVAHIIEDDYSVTPICDCDENVDVTKVVYWDGGGAAGY